MVKHDSALAETKNSHLEFGVILMDSLKLVSTFRWSYRKTNNPIRFVAEEKTKMWGTSKWTIIVIVDKV